MAKTTASNANTTTSDDLTKKVLSTAELMQRLREEKRAEEEEERAKQEAERKRRVETETGNFVPVTRQALYGDLIPETERLLASRKELTQDRGIPTSIAEAAGRVITGQDIIPKPTEFRPGVGPLESKEEVLSRIDSRLAKIEDEKDRLYAKEIGAEETYQDLKKTNTSIRALDTTDVTKDPQRMAELDQLISRRDDLRNDLKGRGTVTSVDGVNIYIPPPEYANNPTYVAAERAASETLRGLLSLAGAIAPGIEAEELENLVPQIRDESDYVNIISEGAQLVTGLGLGLKISNMLIRRAPKVYDALAKTTLGRPAKALTQATGAIAGEGAVATSETGTIVEAFGGEEITDTVGAKLQIMMESFGLSGLGSIAAKTGTKITSLSPVASLLSALPLAIGGTRQGAERAISESLENIITREAKGNWPSEEARLEALADTKKIMMDNYAAQTGGRNLETDIANGNVVRFGGDQEGFPTTLGGLSESETLQEIEQRVAQTSAIPPFKGVQRAREQEFERKTQEVVESALPEREGAPRTRLETQVEAERVGQEAREELATSVERRVAAEQAALQDPIQEQLRVAMQQADEVRTSAQAAGDIAGRKQAQNNAVIANDSAEKLAKQVEQTFIEQRKAKNEMYANYDKIADTVNVDSEELFTQLQTAGDKYNAGDITGIILRDQPEYKKILDGLKSASEGGEPYKMTLKDLESLIRALRTTRSRGNLNNAQINALGDLDTFYQGEINKLLENNPELKEARQIAENAHIRFKETFKNSTGSSIADALQFGDKASDIDSAIVKDQIRSKLKSSATADGKEADRVYLQKVRSLLDDSAKKAFDEAQNAFYKHKILSKINVNLTSEAALAEPIKTINRLNEQLDSVLSSEAYTYAPESVKKEINEMFTDAGAAGDDVARATDALKRVQAEMNAIERTAKTSATYQFAADTQNVEAIAAVNRILASDSSTLKLKNIWEDAGKLGKKGADGLTDNQRKLKAVLAEGIIGSMHTSAARGADKAKLSPAKVEDLVNRNPMFREIFPKDSPTGQVFDHILAMNKVLSTPQKASKAAEQSMQEIKSASDFVQQFIVYVRGPLSKEGRQSKILANVFFKLAGGQEQAADVLAEAFLDPGLAMRLIKEAEERIRQGLQKREEALNFGIAKHLMSRLGINSYEEFNAEQGTVALEMDTGEAFGQ